MAMMTMRRIRNAVFLYGLNLKPKIAAWGIFWMPMGPFVRLSQLLMTFLTISPKPRVAIAR